MVAMERTPKLHVRATGQVATLIGALLVCAGCEKPIFTPDEPRSQYDRMDMVRNTREPSLIPDEFGNLRPNLTGRLSGLK